MHTCYQLYPTRAHYDNNGDYCCVVKEHLSQGSEREDEKRRKGRKYVLNVPDIEDAAKG